MEQNTLFQHIQLYIEHIPSWGMVIIFTIIFLAVFFILRELVCWFLKINTLNENIKESLNVLVNIDKNIVELNDLLKSRKSSIP